MESNAGPRIGSRTFCPRAGDAVLITEVKTRLYMLGAFQNEYTKYSRKYIEV